MSRGTLIINFKNYPEILGERSLRLAKCAEEVSKRTDVELIVAPPAPMLYAVAKNVKLAVFSQRVDNKDAGKSTGAIVAESVKESNCSGSILNHSEARIGIDEVRAIMKRMRALKLSVCLCAESAVEMRKMAGFSPDFLAIEPPELIGTGIAVSTAKPELIRRSVQAAQNGGYRGRVLCGAGIVDGEDVVAAKKLGMNGVLVSSSVVKAADWEEKISELARPLEQR